MSKKNGNGKVNYDAAFNYPLFEAIFNRRSRRFGTGMELPDSTLSHKSSIPPEPLTEFQEAMLVWAGTGLTGYAWLIYLLKMELICYVNGLVELGHQLVTITEQNYFLPMIQDFIL